MWGKGGKSRGPDARAQHKENRNEILFEEERTRMTAALFHWLAAVAQYKNHPDAEERIRGFLKRISDAEDITTFKTAQTEFNEFAKTLNDSIEPKKKGDV